MQTETFIYFLCVVLGVTGWSYQTAMEYPMECLSLIPFCWRNLELKITSILKSCTMCRNDWNSLIGMAVQILLPISFIVYYGYPNALWESWLFIC